MSAVRGAAWVLGGLAGLWLVLVVLLWVFQRQLLYLPDSGDPGAPPEGVEVVTLTTSDGLELDAWFVPATAAASAEPADPPSVASATVLVTPGNAGNRELRLPLARGLVERGHAVLLLDYRGYGGNPGSPHEEGMVRDAHAALDHLEGRDDVDPGRIAYLGESIGTGVAAQLAGSRPPTAGLVLRSPFPDLATVARHHYRIVPVGLLLRDRFETSEVLVDHAAPTLVIAGDADTIVPGELSVDLAVDLGAELVLLPGVGHNDRELLDGARYLDAVDRFLRDTAG